MTTQEAIDYNNELRGKMMQAARKLGLNEMAGTDVADNYIMVIPDDARKGLIFLESRTSYKFGNIRLDLKKAIAAGLELTAAVNFPESFFNYLQLLIVGAFFIQKSTKQELGKLEAYIVYFLHMRNSYNIAIEEENLIRDFQKWFQEVKGKMADAAEIRSAVDDLYKIKVIDIDGGNIYLQECVIGNV